jgi:hypothetical protein
MVNAIFKCHINKQRPKISKQCDFLILNISYSCIFSIAFSLHTFFAFRFHCLRAPKVLLRRVVLPLAPLKIGCSCKVCKSLLINKANHIVFTHTRCTNRADEIKQGNWSFSLCYLNVPNNTRAPSVCFGVYESIYIEQLTVHHWHGGGEKCTKAL